MLAVMVLLNLVLAAQVAPDGTAATWGSAVAAPGQRAHGYLPVPGGDEDVPPLPVTVIRGAKPGPVVALMAGIHGAEYVPILTLQRLAAKLQPETMRGTVVIVHIANVPSFQRRTVYYGPDDWKNLNRVFPGNASGTPTERIAHVLTHEVFDRVDAVVDVHCGDGNEALSPYVAFIANAPDPSVTERSRAMAMAFGAPTVKPLWPDFAGPTRYTSATATARGVPAIGVEWGGEARASPEELNRVEAGLLRVLKQLGVVAGGAAAPGKPRFVTWSESVMSPVHGLFTPGVRPGQRVEAGARLGEIKDAFGRTLAVPVAPFTGVVLYVVTTPPVNPGEPLVSLGQVTNTLPAQPAVAPPRAPPVVLNHFYVVLPAEAFASLRALDFLSDGFAQVDGGLPAFKVPDASAQVLYVRGQDTYLELLGPGNAFGEPVGKVGVGLSVEQEGTLSRLAGPLRTALGQKVHQTRTRRKFEGRGEVPWYDALYREPSAPDTSLDLWVSEYLPEFFQALYPDRPWSAHDVSRRALLGPRFKPERLLRNVERISLELSPRRAHTFIRELVALGYQQVSSPGDVFALQGEGLRWQVREAAQPRGLLEVGFSLNRVKTGPRVYDLGHGAKLEFSKDAPEARWVLANGRRRAVP
ncbi:DUF5829 family protein [Myxococcus sp. AM010]|uniref:DUF5829 family protein n=1 Tax=Myxococcus sp. AM010 TaxID=2745138 RepID=UPI001595CD99|nr:succinylglutamate desuccinylase/aspartoacylase family protein [Myxococcus sp. AM010]